MPKSTDFSNMNKLPYLSQFRRFEYSLSTSLFILETTPESLRTVPRPQGVVLEESDLELSVLKAWHTFQNEGLIQEAVEQSIAQNHWPQTF